MDKLDYNLANLYLSNERTLLAWIRTGIGIMIFGFVVVRFSLSINPGSEEVITNGDIKAMDMSTAIGVGLVALGALATVASYIHYRFTIRKLERGEYNHSVLLGTLVTAAVLLLSIVLILYMLGVGSAAPQTHSSIEPSAMPSDL